MTTSITSCGPCDIQYITKPSIVWCTECEEGLCPQCQKHHSASKASQSHNTMSITEYQELPIEVQQITENCNKHNEKYTIYCKKHECLCCGSCVIIDHIDCREFSRLTDIIGETKTSEALNEIEQSLSELAENIKAIRQNRDKNMKTLSEQKRHIEQEIKETRTKINNHLAQIQDDIMSTLNTAEETERCLINQSFIILDEKGSEISDHQRKIVKIKQHATDFQTFLLLKQLENEVFSKNQFLQTLVDTESLKEIELSYHVHAVIHKFVTDINNFGDVVIEKKPCDVVLSRRKVKQAQLLVPHVSNRSVKDIKLKLHRKFYNIEQNVFGCCILPNEKVAFTYYGYRILKVFNTDGSKEFEVITPTWAFDVVYIKEDTTLAVTSGDSERQCIIIIDIQHKQIKNEISVDSKYYGITMQNTTFICSAAEKGIQGINPYNHSTKEIVCEKLPNLCYVAHFDNKFYHTNRQTNSVTCYDKQGKLQWTFKNESVLMTPHGISVDNDGNAYIVGRTSNNVVVISADGQHHKEILTASDGLIAPYSLDYCGSTNQLLVANYRNNAMVFSLI